MKNCYECERTQTGNALSLDSLAETMEHSPDSQPLEEDLEAQELYDALHRAIYELNDTDRTILTLFSHGLSEREIGPVVGLSQESVNNHKGKALSLPREKLKEFI